MILTYDLIVLPAGILAALLGISLVSAIWPHAL
jgi:hypothetical protein